jgi:aspartate/methionine/tyrosine aminotransferase
MIIAAADRLNQVSEYYFSQKLAEIRKLAAQGKEVINLGIGNPDLTPSQETIQALCNEAMREHNHGYQPYRGIPELREALSDWYDKTYQVTLNPDGEILPLIGSKEGIFHISMSFLNPGDKVLVPDPGYPGYAAAAQLVGAKNVNYDLTEENNWLPNLATFENMDFSGIKMMWINYPHMPTGASASLSDFEELIRFSQKKGILLCHDNPYSLIGNSEPPKSIMQTPKAKENCLELNSLSKSHNMAGWRVGMVAGDKSYLDAILSVKSNIDSGMFRPIQLAAIQALKNGKIWHNQQNEIYNRRRTLLYRLLDRLGFSYSKGLSGLFVWAKAPDYLTDVEEFLNNLLYEKGIFLAPGKIFGKNGIRYARASICVTEKIIQKAIERIKLHQEVQS